MDQHIPKQKNKFPLSGQALFFSIIALVMFGAIMYMQLKILHGQHPGKAGEEGWTSEQMRTYANRLKSDGLAEQATAAYEKYLASADIEFAARAKIYFSIGDMLLKADRYEDALSYLYKAEIADPDTELKQEIGSAIVTCLERLGRGLDAEYQLEARTTLSGDEAIHKPAGEVVARIGMREITMGELNAEMERLPEWVRERITSDEKRKLQFLQQYVANELLYDKGIKLGIHKDPKVREQIKDVKKQLVIQRVITEEITDKIKIDQEDVKNYFEAHADDYRDETRVKFRHILVDDEDEAARMVERLQAGELFEALAKEKSKDEASRENGGEVSGWTVDDGQIPDVGYDEDFTSALLAMDAGRGPHVIPSSYGVHVVEITEKEEGRAHDFDEAAKQVRYDYQADKEARLGQELLVKMLGSKDVHIYTEKFITPEDLTENDDEDYAP